MLNPADIADEVRWENGMALDEIIQIDGWKLQELLESAIVADRKARLAQP